MLGRFQAWLMVYPRKREILFLLTLMVLMEITILSFKFSFDLNNCDCSFREFVNVKSAADQVGDISVVWFVLLAFWEEVVFRIIPLAIALRLWGVRLPTLIVLLISSVIFALLHSGVSSLFVQGPGGFFYGLLFIKYGMSKRAWVKRALAIEYDDRHVTFARVLYAGVMVTLIHASYNIMLTVVIFMMGGSFRFPPLI